MLQHTDCRLARFCKMQHYGLLSKVHIINHFFKSLGIIFGKLVSIGLKGNL